MTNQKSSFGSPSGILQEIIAMLEPLSPEDREKVLRSTHAFFGTSTPVARALIPQAPSEAVEVSPGLSFDHFGAALKGKDNLRPGPKAALIAFCLVKSMKKEAFSMEELRDAYNSLGFTPPDRIEMTVRGAASGGTALFHYKGRKQYVLTFSGKELAKELLKT